VREGNLAGVASAASTRTYLQSGSGSGASLIVLHHRLRIGAVRLHGKAMLLLKQRWLQQGPSKPGEMQMGRIGCTFAVVQRCVGPYASVDG
jgi:hypothetical protein